MMVMPTLGDSAHLVDEYLPRLIEAAQRPHREELLSSIAADIRAELGPSGEDLRPSGCIFDVLEAVAWRIANGQDGVQS